VSERARTWVLRLLALGIAIGIWFNASVEDRLVTSEKVVEAYISYNRRPGFMIINPVQRVDVRLIGNKKAIRQLSPYMVDVSVELSRQGTGASTVTLGPENVLAPEGLEVVSIEPATIPVDLEREVTERLPVVPKLVGRPAPGVKVDEPEVFPNQVMVIGPEPLLARIDSLATRPINIEGLSSSLEEDDVPVVTPDPLIQIVQPSKVSVRVPIHKLPATPAGVSNDRKDKT
jgi:YbbR domain-containing protein